MALNRKQKSLADKISSLITAAPANFDSDDEVEETKAKVVETYDESENSDEDFRQSNIRKQTVNLLDQEDKRYEGKKVSRKHLHGEESDDAPSGDLESNISADEAEETEDEGEEKRSNEGTDDSDEEEVEDSESGVEDNSNDETKEMESNEEDNSGESNQASDSEEEDGYDVDIGNPLYRDRSDANFKTMSEVNVRADVEKGNCVRSQLKLWESLLEMRIQLQKCLVSSNQMPQYDMHKEFKSNAEFRTKTNETKSKLTDLLDNMVKLQDTLLKQYPETKNLGTVKNKRKTNSSIEENMNIDDPIDEEIPSDTDNELDKEEESGREDEDVEEIKESPRKKLKLSDYEKVLKERHDLYLDYRNSIIQKWNDKTRIASGAIKKGSNLTALKQIEFAMSDKPKLRKKTQLKRSEYIIVGKPINDEEDNGRRTQEYDCEIYDDDDFYHQLLRDLIEYKSAGVTDPIQLSKQWIQLQNMRRKMKRKIDTRATKGRRVRYDVHNKLVNFMAPITVFDTWTDLAKNELYNSLFGKFKSTQEQVGH